MHHLQPLLERIGFNHNESAMYLYLLEHGEHTASHVAKELRMPRTTIRGGLDHLCELGAMQKMYRQNVQYYQCTSPTHLVDILEQRMQNTEKILSEVKETLPMLEGLFAKRTVVPKVRFFEGIDQVITAFDSTLYAEGVDEILVLTSYDFLRHPELRKHDDEFYIPMRVKKGIPLKSIVGDTGSDMDDKRVQMQPEELRERRFFPREYAFPGTFYIYGDAVLYFSVASGECMAVIIESAHMAETMRALHKFMWNACAYKN